MAAIKKILKEKSKSPESVQILEKTMKKSAPIRKKVVIRRSASAKVKPAEVEVTPTTASTNTVKPAEEKTKPAVQTASQTVPKNDDANSLRAAIKKTVESQPPVVSGKPIDENLRRVQEQLKNKTEIAKAEVIKVISEEIQKKEAQKSTVPTTQAAPTKKEFNNLMKPAPSPVEQKMINEFAAPAHRPVRIYKRISISFAIIVLFLLGLVSYYSLIKTTIIIEPKEALITGNLSLDVYDENTAPSKDGGIVGAVKEVSVEAENVFQASGGQVLGEEAVGKVKIINNYIKNQPLVATTRLLTADNKLFRIKDTVNVPAGGVAEAEIYADQPSQAMAIGPSKFTIPGLWAGIQDKIYAESDSPVIYREKKQAVIEEADLEKAEKDLKEALAKKVENEVIKSYKSTYGQVLSEINDVSSDFTSDGQAGEEKDIFNAKLTAKVIVVAFNDDAVKKLAEQKLLSSLQEGRELAQFNKDKIIYNLGAFDIEKGNATVEAAFDGKAMPKSDASFIDKQKLVGLSADQLSQYLSGIPEIAGFEMKFSPSFFRRSANSVDHIFIEFKK